jgi:hypothetical protein
VASLVINGEEKGRVRVDLRFLLTWFYTVRAEARYGMGEIWRKAQN